MSVTWAVGWYWKRSPRHAFPVGQTVDVRNGVSTPALCRARVYPFGFVTAWGLDVPAGNTPDVMARPACKHCERKAAKR